MHTSVSSRSVLALAISLAFVGTNTSAATITVTSTDDAFESASCNLRSAMASINAGSAKGSCVAVGDFGDTDTIVFAPALANSTITLAHGELVVLGAMTISGSGQTIDADFGSRAMYVGYGASLYAHDLTLTHGYTSGGRRQSEGAGLYIYRGGAVLARTTISGNMGSASGAGIHVNGGSLALVHSTVANNVTSGDTGGVSAYASSVQISDSILSGNTGSSTGGLSVYAAEYTDASLTMTRSTVSNNTASCSKNLCVGGIYVGYRTYLSAIDATISGNMAAGKVDVVAGGLYLSYAGMHLANSTVSGNIARGNNYVAGGIWQSSNNGNSVLIVNSTISANGTTTYNASAAVKSGLMFGYLGYAKATLNNSIIAGNTSGTDFGMKAGSNIAMASCVAGTVANVAPFNSNPSNHFTDAPGLGALQNNGGFTQTMALLTGSVAIDAGNNGFAPALYDQRGAGFARVFNSRIDIGAVEYQGDRLFADGFESGP